jgi:putative FmdB family regulatory protein
MPTYEYECQKCHQRIEAVQKFSDAPLSVCESCGGELRKVFSGVGIVFKGSGFYKTDSRGSSSASAPPIAATPPAAAPPAASSTSSD